MVKVIVVHSFDQLEFLFLSTDDQVELLIGPKTDNQLPHFLLKVKSSQVWGRVLCNKCVWLLCSGSLSTVVSIATAHLQLPKKNTGLTHTHFFSYQETTWIFVSGLIIADTSQYHRKVRSSTTVGEVHLKVFVVMLIITSCETCGNKHRQLSIL